MRCFTLVDLMSHVTEVITSLYASTVESLEQG